MKINEESKINSNWWVYLIRNRHNSLYCGITNNLDRRLQMHREGTGAKALRGKGPLTLEWFQVLDNKSLALKLEYRIKKMSKVQKEHIVKEKMTLTNLYSE